MIDKELLLGLGMDEDTAIALLEMIAEQTAQAVAAGAEVLRQKQAQALPRLVAATPGGGAMDEGHFAQMGYSARASLYSEHPKLYRTLAGTSR